MTEDGLAAMAGMLKSGTAHAIDLLDGAATRLMESDTSPLLLVPALVEVLARTAARDPENEQLLLDSAAATLSAAAQGKRAGQVMSMARAILSEPGNA